MIGSTYGLMAALLPRETARDIYGPPERWRPAPCGPPVQRVWSRAATASTARSAFASGIPHATYWNAGCFVIDGATRRTSADGAAEVRMVFFPPQDGELIDTWHVGGLRGTGGRD